MTLPGCVSGTGSGPLRAVLGRRTYNTRRAVGWGHFGKRYICNARFAVGDTCVKITLTSPVTDRAGDHYFNHLLFQPATMGGDSRWSWRTATYNGRF